MDGDQVTASKGDAVTLVLDTDLDISRGDMIAGSQEMLRAAKEYEADICWLSERPLDLRRKYGTPPARIGTTASRWTAMLRG